MKKYFALICILFIAAILRLWQLGSTPISLDWDETALGWNAYSILKTGRDEYGTVFPMSLRSFDDYKPPMYVYLTVPSVAVFGLTPFATRLPSAIMGIAGVLGVFVLGRELWRKNKYVPYVAASLLAISPWHIQFSRVAFEANVGVTFHIWAITTFLIALRKKALFPISAVLFGLGMYTYHSERVFLPLMLCFLLVLFRKTVFSKAYKKTLIFGIVAGFLVVLPLLPVLFGKSGMMRLSGTNALSDQTNLLGRTIAKLELDQKLGDKIGLLLDNRRIVWVKTVIAGYLSHFSLRWLFLTPDNPRHHAPDMGLLYIWELPFFLYGIYALLKSKDKTVAIFILGWMLLAPVPASITTGLPHSVRTLVFLPTFQLIIAYATIDIISRTKRFVRYGIISIGMLCLIANCVYYLDKYYVHMNSEYSEFWQYGNREAVERAEALKYKYDKVVVSTQIDQAYMFFLFYTKYDPIKYLAEGGTNSGSFEEARNKFDKYEFRRIDWPKEKRDGSILYIGTLNDMPHGNVANIMYLNGKPAIEMADAPNGGQ